jgi:ribosome biogenesis GTPase A
MPLEEILKLKHTDLDDFAGEEPYWTADTLLTAYAISQGFVTAKAGRPDLYRAGAFIMRQIHSSAIPWGFWPPSNGKGVPKVSSMTKIRSIDYCF